MSVHHAYRCPRCIAPLIVGTDSLTCARCGSAYPVTGRVADFSGGRYYDHFDETTPLGAEHVRGLELENEGAVTRIESYYRPRIASLSARGRILDAGCGNGISVDLLLAAGYEAWGIDLSALRRWQWRERSNPDHLAVADAAQLPFADGFFDVVLSSGVLEHIGVQELLDGGYKVTVLPERDTARRAFLTELLRVIAPGGTLYLDFPNGAFPIDFWHNSRSGKPRFHSSGEGFLPTVTEIRSLTREIDPRYQVSALSPNGRLAFRQARQHWYGRLFSSPTRLFFKLMDGIPMLAASPINPYLVIRIVKGR